LNSAGRFRCINRKPIRPITGFATLLTQATGLLTLTPVGLVSH
jgi:hypothetical protein